MPTLYEILRWAEDQGEIKIVSRIRLKVLPMTLKEKIFLSHVEPQTTCSPELQAKVLEVAEQLVGKSFRF